jgi:hypothetical protein
MIWIPVTAGLVWLGLRIAKAALLYSEFTRGAGKGP